MKLYTEEQVREMLKQQEQSISDNASVGNGTVFTKISVKWPAPIQAIPVEKIQEAIKEIEVNSVGLSSESITENKVKMGILITLDLIKEKLTKD